MDSGCPGAVDALEETYDLQRDISPQEVIGIMDQLLCHEASILFALPDAVAADINQDGMAPGISTVANHPHKSLCGGSYRAAANKHRASRFRRQGQAPDRADSNAECFTRILLGHAQSLLLRQ